MIFCRALKPVQFSIAALGVTKSSTSSASPESNVTLVSYARYQANDPVEDRILVSLGDFSGDTVLAVMDGHGGWQVAEFVQARLAEYVRRGLQSVAENSSAALQSALVKSFVELDNDYIATILPAWQAGFGLVSRVGTCCVAVVVQPDGTIICANAGDCRAVIGRRVVDTAVATPSLSGVFGVRSDNGSASGSASAAAAAKTATAAAEVTTTTWRYKPSDLSRDHNAKEALEQVRIQKQHPEEAMSELVQCMRQGVCYVKGRLQPTRAFGDLYLKRADFNGPPMARGLGPGSGPKSGGGGGSSNHIQDKSENNAVVAVAGSGGGSGVAASSLQQQQMQQQQMQQQRDNADGSAGVHVGSPFNPPYITVEPDVTVTTTTPAGRPTTTLSTTSSSSSTTPLPPPAFVVLASDGLWDLMSSEEAVAIVAARCCSTAANSGSSSNALSPATAAGNHQPQGGTQQEGWGWGALRGSFGRSTPPPAIGGLEEVFSDGIGGNGGSGSVRPIAAAGRRREVAEENAADVAVLEASAQAVLDEALRRAAREWGMSVEELQRLTPGRMRRQRHDDISVVVAFLK